MLGMKIMYTCIGNRYCHIFTNTVLCHNYVAYKTLVYQQTAKLYLLMNPHSAVISNAHFSG
jgi:hypothetical protein